MAANSSSRGIANLGKRVVDQIWTRDPTHRSASSLSSVTLRRAIQTSAYEKNPEELVQPSVVPDELIPPHSDKYWAPHPQTGVFGPATEAKAAGEGRGGFHASVPANGGEDSVLEQKAWFRPTSIEDLEKPVMH